MFLATSYVTALSVAQAYNARRQADLDALQAEADGVVRHLREQQRALATREREAGGREKQLALRWDGGFGGWGRAGGWAWGWT
jgi:hypothetical protein